MPIPLLVLALAIGGMTIELLWSQGAMIAFLSVPVAASVGTALIPSASCGSAARKIPINILPALMTACGRS